MATRFTRCWFVFGFSAIALAGLLWGAGQSQAGTITTNVITDANIGTFINTGKTYTHALDFGANAGTTINGVAFSQANAAAASGGTIPNFSYTTNTGPVGETAGAGGAGGVFPPNGITDNGNNAAGLDDLLRDFIYAGGTATNGGSQTYTLTGLTIGQTYTTRIYYRHWEGASGTTRNVTMNFTSGVDNGTVTINEDKPHLTTGSAIAPGTGINDAIMLNYTFTAGATSLTIQAVHNQVTGIGTYHMYGLSNEVSPVPEPSSIALASLAVAGAGLYGWRRRAK